MCSPLICKCFSAGSVLGSSPADQGEPAPATAGGRPGPSWAQRAPGGPRTKKQGSLCLAPARGAFSPWRSISVIFEGTCLLICFSGSRANKWATAEQLSDEQ